MALTALLICIFVIVPLQTNLIIDAIHSINGKKKKKPKKTKKTKILHFLAYGGAYRGGFLYKPPFVLVVGDIDDFSIENFLEEFYHKKSC